MSSTMNVLIIGAGEINFGKYESIAIVHLRCDGDWTNDQGRSKALGTTYVLSPYPQMNECKTLTDQNRLARIPCIRRRGAWKGEIVP